MKGAILLSSFTLIALGILAVIILDVIFFGFVLKHSESNSSEIDRLIELNGMSDRRKIEKFMNDNDFYHVFQPFIDSRTNEIVGCEALTRLRGEKAGVTMPDSFLEKVRNEKLYDKFDMFVFGKCCEWLKSRGSDKPFVVTCNFSRRTLSADKSAKKIIRIAEEIGVSPENMAIEITEDSVRSCDNTMAENISELKSEGFKIYLDDFGKAYTSIDDLTKFCPDVIKIDRNMLYNAKERQGRVVFESVIRLARSIGAGVLCEGIETEEQAQIAKDAGCDFLQGFYYYKPMSAESLEGLL